MKKPLVLDLFCGLWGWTEGFIAQGWQSVGIDLKLPRSIPEGARFAQYDILELRPKHIRSLKPDFIVCSSPCEEFSIHCMKHFHKNPAHPHLGLLLFNHSRMLCESSGVRYVMENVRCAERFVGKATNHCGPFYLWGSGVPAIMPRVLYEVTKGKSFRGAPGAYMDKRPINVTVKQWRNIYQTEAERMAGGRKNCANFAALIPSTLSSYIAQCALSMVNQ